MNIDYAIRHDVDSIRGQPDDDARVIESDSGLVAVAAHTMHGNVGGMLGSRIAIEVIREHVVAPRRQVNSEPDPLPWSAYDDYHDGARDWLEHHFDGFDDETDPVDEQLHRAVEHAHRVLQHANQTVANLSEPESLFAGAGYTTLAAMHVHDDRTEVVHAGTSRVYRLRNGRLSRLTTDHTIETTDEYVRLIPDRLLGWNDDQLGKLADGRLVGHDSSDLHPGDRYLICTPGLTNRLADDRITALLSQSDASPSACLTALSDAAHGPDGCGGVDLSAVLLDIHS